MKLHKSTEYKSYFSTSYPHPFHVFPLSNFTLREAKLQLPSILNLQAISISYRMIYDEPYQRATLPLSCPLAEKQPTISI